MKYEVGKTYNIENPKNDILIRENVQPLSRDAEEYLLSGSEEAESFLNSIELKGVQEATSGYIKDGKLYLNTGYHRYTGAIIKKKSLPVTIVEEPSVSEQISTQIHSNKNRAMTLLQKGQAYVAYREAIKAESGKAPTQAQIAKEMGVTQPEISQAITMAEAPTSLVRSLEKGTISVKGAQAVIKKTKSVSKQAEKNWNTENKEKLEKFEDNPDKIALLEEQKHNFINKKVNKVVKDEVKTFRESNKPAKRGRPKGSVRKDSTENNDEGADECTLVISSDDSIEEIFNQFFAALKETHDLSPERALDQITNQMSSKSKAA